MKSKNLVIRIEPEWSQRMEQLAPEGNVSMWVRSLIRRELEQAKKDEENKEQASKP